MIIFYNFYILKIIETFGFQTIINKVGKNSSRLAFEKLEKVKCYRKTTLLYNIVYKTSNFCKRISTLRSYTKHLSFMYGFLKNLQLVKFIFKFLLIHYSLLHHYIKSNTIFSNKLRIWIFRVRKIGRRRCY